MLFLLLFAALFCGVLFLVLDHAGEYIIEHRLDESDYFAKRNSELMASLQEYITEGNLQSRDTEKLSAWVKEQKMVQLNVYKDGIQVFDSNYPDQEIWTNEIVRSDYDWMSYNTVVFSDGEAEITLTGNYRYQIYTQVRILELSICFFLFLTIVLLGIRRKMAYILLLSREVEILEGGSLGIPITVKSSDELSVLAEGLESMRRSFLEAKAEEEKIVAENQRVITEMSHDLRTPITAVMLYAEILKKEKYKDESQRREYILKIEKKALQMKERTDRLLEYSLKSGHNQTVKLETGTLSEVFFDLFSEACGYLEQKGFQLDVQVPWKDLQIQYNMDYVVRILDNITSNIVKYADAETPVRIVLMQTDKRIGFLFQNRIQSADGSVESNGIGEHSIIKMMQEMGGECRSGITEGVYWIGIWFLTLRTDIPEIRERR